MPVPKEDSKYVLDRMSFWDLFKREEDIRPTYEEICEEYRREHGKVPSQRTNEEN